MSITVVANNTQLRNALVAANPGDIVEMAPGTYAKWGVSLKSGAAGSPIIVRAQYPLNKPVIDAVNANGSNGILIQNCSYMTFQGLRIINCLSNGIQANYVTWGDRLVGLAFEDIEIENVGDQIEGNNTDGFHLGSLDNFTIRRCWVSGWVGQALDCVGCGNGLVEDFDAIGKADWPSSSGIQFKGYSHDVTIRRALIVGRSNKSTANFEAVSLGGSTAMKYMGDAQYEGQRITLEDSEIQETISGIFFDGCEGCIVQRNKIVAPTGGGGLIYIWRNNTDPQILNTANGIVRDNLFIYDKAQLTSGYFVRLLPDRTKIDEETFTFSGNTWCCRDNGGSPYPPVPPGGNVHLALPVAETDGIYLGTVAPSDANDFWAANGAGLDLVQAASVRLSQFDYGSPPRFTSDSSSQDFTESVTFGLGLQQSSVAAVAAVALATFQGSIGTAPAAAGGANPSATLACDLQQSAAAAVAAAALAAFHNQPMTSASAAALVLPLVQLSTVFAVDSPTGNVIRVTAALAMVQSVTSSAEVVANALANLASQVQVNGAVGFEASVVLGIVQGVAAQGQAMSELLARLGVSAVLTGPAQAAAAAILQFNLRQAVETSALTPTQKTIIIQLLEQGRYL